MTIKTILQLGDSVLRKKCESVKSLDECKSTITDLRDTLYFAKKKYSTGRGIAAPQIGILKRIIYVVCKDFKGPLIDPRIIEKGKRTFEVWDSCFSFDIRFFVKVKRHFKIIVEYFDAEGAKRKITAISDLSELLQHEIDHLDGILAIDRMKDKCIIMKFEYEKLLKMKKR